MQGLSFLVVWAGGSLGAPAVHGLSFLVVWAGGFLGAPAVQELSFLVVWAGGLLYKKDILVAVVVMMV